MTFALPPRPTFPAAPTVKPTRPAKSKQEAEARAASFRASVRRQAQLRRAAEVLPHLPGPGESVHVLLTGYFDLMLVLTCIVQSRAATCQSMRVATLAFSRKNVEELCSLLDAGKVRRVSLLCSDYMRKANPSIYQGAAEALRGERGQHVGSARSHCKVVCLSFDDGLRLTMEGSANLRTNRNVEQLTVINDRVLHDWHAAWIDERVRDGEAKESAEAAG
jgi:hypothetical protein